MAETLISPGVLARENDQSQVTQGPIEAGAAIVGPTVKGPVGIPTVVTSYSDYSNKFGTTLVSGGATYSYLTSVAAYNYFNNGGNTLLVTRVVTGSFTAATSSQANNSINAVAGAFANASFTFNLVAETGSYRAVALEINDNLYYFAGADFQAISTTADYYYFNVNMTTNWNLNAWGSALATAINSFDTNQYVTATWSTNRLILSSSAPGTGNGIELFTQGYVFAPTSSMIPAATLAGATANISANAFTLETLTQGANQNSVSTELAGGVLRSGSADNIRWQITGVNTGSGTFNLVVRRGNDSTNTPAVLETWNNLSLDPLAPNYIEAVIGNQAFSVNTDDSTYYIQTTGTYTNKSRYVRVKTVDYPTPNYLNSNGAINSGSDGNSFTKYIPTAASGTFGGAAGTNFVGGGTAFYNATTTATNIQGIPAANYNTSITLLGNQDDYRFNILTAPGLTQQNAPSQVSAIVSTCQNRGDAIAVVDVAAYGATVGTVTNNATAYNNSYAATYWPWLQTIDPDTGKAVFVPASTMIPGVYAYNDSVAEPWFAPAGINRGGLSTVVQAERRLAQTDRDTLYINNVNPIATFPGTGVVVYGQKTLQKAASALDRVNVRRLLIALKGYISQVANNLVFEQNTTATRNNFLAQVNPYLESVQQRQGLYAFKVVMDDSNNTPDVIDRNQLVGQIYLQPTKTAEFVLLDFNILPTGATFS